MLISLETIDRIMSLSLKAQAILVTSACSCLVVGIVITSPLSSFIPQAQAQSRRVRYIPPSNLDAPQTSGAGASRSAIVLIAILPDLQIDKSPVPQTISERPTIYFLTPKHRGSVTIKLPHPINSFMKRNLKSIMMQESLLSSSPMTLQP